MQSAETIKRAPACRGGHRFDPDQVHQLFNMPSVYILQSQLTKRYYIGSSLNPEFRLAEHQRGQTRSTRGRGPWELVYREDFSTKEEALRREIQLKNWKSHRSIQELIDAKR